MQLTSRNKKSGSKTSVAMDPEGLVMFAAICVTALTGKTGLAIQIRLDGTPVANFHVGDAGTDGEHFDAKFMSRNSRVGKERHLSQVAGKIRSANTNMIDPDEGLIGSWRWGFRDFDHPPFEWIH